VLREPSRGVLVAALAILFGLGHWLAGALVTAVALVPVAALLDSVLIWLRMGNPRHWPDDHLRVTSVRTAPRLPAGTHDQPPLPVEQLDRRAWAVLTWRQEHLPLQHLRRRSDWEAMQSLEQRAVWDIADQLRLDDDQRYSLLWRHGERVRQVAQDASPTAAGLIQPARTSPTGTLRRATRRRFRWSWLVPGFMVGWPTWFANRRVDTMVFVRDTRFRLLTRSTYAKQPQLHS